MKFVDDTLYYYNERKMNCAEAILLAANENYPLRLSGEEDARIVMGFGGGLGCGKLCGSLAACISVLGVLYYKRPDIREICAKFTKKFEEAFEVNSIDCEPISAKFKTPEKRCEAAVILAVETLANFIETL